jgi:DHA2 family multidrug resistance protein
MLTNKKPFINPALFKDANFVMGNFFIFVVGVVLFATLALLPPLLQDLMNYPVVTTGLVTAPRGAGMMLAMSVAGRLVGRVDARLLMGAGIIATALSLWQLTHISLLMDWWPIITSGLLQGFGIGLVYVPLSTVAFATLSGSLRTEGTALFSLLRNLGSSVGISVVQIFLTRNTQILHADLAENITPYNAAIKPGLQSGHFDMTSLQGLTALNAEVTRQASMIAYIDDFQLIMVMTLVLLPLLLLLKRPKKQEPGEHIAVME